MATFPADPVPVFPVLLTQRWKTVVTAMDGQNEQRKKKASWPKYDVSLTFDVLAQSEFRTLWDFYLARGGAFEEFWFFTYETDTWPAQYVGTGDGETTTFDLPGKSTSTQTIYVDGEAQGSGFSILTGGGGGSADRVQFSAAPSAGAVISAAFTGYLRCRMRFEDDTMDRDYFTVALYRTGLRLKGLAPDG